MFRIFFFPNKPYLFKPKLKTRRFGLMWFEKRRKNQESHYQGYFTFKPTINNKVNIFIDAKKGELSRESLLFFDEFERNYTKICDNLKKPLSDKLSQQELPKIEINNIKHDFKLDAIIIKKTTPEKQLWRVRFTNSDIAITGVTFHFENWDLVKIT
ncbi:hypothetical protein [uncultured Kordia sp.]|uniref:hypothetical protein n=1 Tax=uncultured Kordia sp. TaxID=507699 RepID=UPI00260D5CD6|nr:hypothetical protein [uncultured Kordia sp.]